MGFGRGTTVTDVVVVDVILVLLGKVLVVGRVEEEEEALVAGIIPFSRMSSSGALRASGSALPVGLEVFLALVVDVMLLLLLDAGCWMRDAVDL